MEQEKTLEELREEVATLEEEVKELHKIHIDSISPTTTNGKIAELTMKNKMLTQELDFSKERLESSNSYKKQEHHRNTMSKFDDNRIV